MSTLIKVVFYLSEMSDGSGGFGTFGTYLTCVDVFLLVGTFLWPGF